MSEALASAIEKIGAAFTEYKDANDARLAEIAKRGAADPLLDEKLKRIDEVLDAQTEMKTRLEQAETRAARPGGAGLAGSENVNPEAIAYRNAFLGWVRNPRDPRAEMKARETAKALYAKAASDDLETRATQTVTSTGSAGGFALPEIIERAIARLSVDISPIRQIATVRTVGSPDYKELFDVNGAAFEWLGEAATRNQTNTPNLA